MIDALPFLALTVALSVASQVLQKQVALSASGGEGRSAAGQLGFYAAQPRFWLALLFLGLGMLSWLVVLDMMDVGRAYTLLSANYILMLPVSRLVFREVIPTTRWLGAGIISVGLILMSVS